MLKLYLPYGSLRSFKGPGASVMLHWFIRERAEPIGPYEKLVESYAKLGPEDRHRAEQMVDEFFTEEEFVALRDYLFRKYREDLRTGMLIPPISAARQDNDKNRRLIRPFGLCQTGDGGGFCELFEEDGYSLPFTVSGYYAAVATRPMAEPVL